MGGGASKAHVIELVTPAFPVDEETPPVTAADLLADNSEALSVLEAILGELGPAESTGSVFEQFAHLGTNCHEFDDALAGVGEGLAPVSVQSLLAAKKKATNDWLNALSQEQLQQLAIAAGFEHPTLVGFDPQPGKQHPLVHWLDPSFAPLIPSKEKIQAKAKERWGQLLSGETLSGPNGEEVTLADVTAAEVALEPDPYGWAATAADIDQLKTEWDELEAKVSGYGRERWRARLDQALIVHRLVHATGQPQSGKDLVASTLGKGHGMADATGHWTWQVALEDEDVGHVADKLGWSTDEVLVTTPGQLVRAALDGAGPYSSTPRAQLQGVAQKLIEDAKALGPAVAALEELTVGGLEPKSSADDIAGAVKALKAAAATRPLVVAPFCNEPGTLAHRLALSGLSKEKWDAVYGALKSPSALESHLGPWLHSSKLSDLKKIAAELGLESGGGATRVQVQHWLAAKVAGSPYQLDEWEKKATASTAKAQSKKEAANAAKVSMSPAEKALAKAAMTPAEKAVSKTVGKAVGKLSFNAKRLAAFEALRHAVASKVNLGSRMTQAQVDALALEPVALANPGGMQSKSFFKDQAGAVWMAKFDRSNTGCRAAAEAAASEVCAAAGIPTVPVYVRTVKGKTASFQPMIDAKHAIEGSPASWSQADVDALVRHHVASWVVGDHDATAVNVLRLGTGGLVPIDHGQAWKYFGRDKLSVDYHPNASYGAPEPIFHSLYKAAKSGGLAPGVKVRPQAAISAIKALEQIPEPAYRSMLERVADDGAAAQANWHEPMKKLAAKRHGTTNPSPSQVKEEFLARANERRAGVRAEFAKFFGDLQFEGTAALVDVA